MGEMGGVEREGGAYVCVVGRGVFMKRYSEKKKTT